MNISDIISFVLTILNFLSSSILLSMVGFVYDAYVCVCPSVCSSKCIHDEARGGVLVYSLKLFTFFEMVPIMVSGACCFSYSDHLESHWDLPVCVSIPSDGITVR